LLQVEFLCFSFVVLSQLNSAQIVIDAKASFQDSFKYTYPDKLLQAVDFKSHILEFSGFLWHESDVSIIVFFPKISKIGSCTIYLRLLF